MKLFKLSSGTQRCLRVCGPVFLLFMVICPLGYFYHIELFQSACALLTMPAYIASIIGEQWVARIIGGYDHKWTLAALFSSYATVALAWIVCALSPWWLFVRMTWGNRLCLQVAILVVGYLVSMFLGGFVDFPSPD